MSIQPFIKLPEIQINIKEVLTTVSKLSDADWESLPWGQFVFCDWKDNQEIAKLISMFSYPINMRMVECMKFNPGTGLPVHKDNIRLSVIQIPISANCSSAPTLFYDDQGVQCNQLTWDDASGWMFDTHVSHSVLNNTLDPRYMLCVSFYKHNYSELLNLYERGMLLRN